MKLHSVALAAALALSASAFAASAPVAMEQLAGRAADRPAPAAASMVWVTHTPTHVVKKHTVRHTRTTHRREVRRTTKVRRERDRSVAVAPDNANDANRRQRMDEALERYRSTHKSS